jgi:hypothetical protein
MAESRTNRARPRRNPELEDFKLWLATLEGKPILHVNGASYSSAVVTVDFGSPLEEQKLTPEVAGELVTRIRSLTRNLSKGNDSNIRVQNDTGNGIWWSSIG